MKLGKLIGEGKTAEVYEIKNNKIIKLFNKETRKSQIKYEFKINALLSSYDLPIIKPYKIVRCKRRTGIIFDKISGTTMLQNIFDNMYDVKTYAKNLANLHYRIHNITYNIPLEDYQQSLIHNIKNIDLLGCDIKDKIISYTNALPNGNTLCHGDFHPENVLIDNNNYYIIDWATAKKGYYLCDVARTVTILKYAIIEENTPLDAKKRFDEIKLNLLNYYLDCYTSLSNTSIKDIEKWELPLVATRLNENITQQEKNLLLEYIYNQVKK